MIIIQQKLFVITLFSLPLIIPVWSVSQNSVKEAIWEKIQILNDEGIRFCGQKDYHRSIEYFQNALKLAPDQKVIAKNLANAYMELAVELKSKGETEKAIAILEKASDINTDIDSLHTLLAKLYYDKGDFLGAEKEARIALTLKPNDPYLLKFIGYLNCLMEDYNEAIETYDTLNKKFSIPLDQDSLKKVKAEQEVFEKYERIKCHPFIIYYPDNNYKAHAVTVSKALAETYLKLSSWWGFTPQSEINVYLYPEDNFRKITQSQGYVVGIYDGKIRLLIMGDNMPALSKTAMHEYTHHALMCVTNSNVPFWLNEGIAQYVAGQWDPLRSKLFDLAIERGALIGFDRLNSSNGCLYDVHERKLAYLQSYVAIDYLISEYGQGVILDFIKELKKGKESESAFEDITLSSYKSFTSEITSFYCEKRKGKLLAKAQ